MKHFITLLLLVVAFISFGRVSDAQTVKVTPQKTSLLYEITGPGLKQPSYLFGTIHLICNKDMSVERLTAYIEKTNQLLLEFDMRDPSVIQKAIEYSMLKDGKSVKDYLTPEEYAKADALYKDYLGISFDLLQRLKPIVSSTYFFTSPKILGCQSPVLFDRFLSQLAVSKTIQVIGLETAEQQIAVIDSVPLEKQVKELNSMVADPQKDIAEFQNLYKLYLAQDADGLYNMAADSVKKRGYSQEKMLDSRNTNWIPIIEKNMTLKPTFIAVGAGHLSGQKGLVNLLRSRGYKLTPIRL